MTTSDSSLTAFLPHEKAPKTLHRSLTKPAANLLLLPTEGLEEDKIPLLQHHHIGEVLRSVL